MQVQVAVLVWVLVVVVVVVPPKPQTEQVQVQVHAQGSGWPPDLLPQQCRKPPLGDACVGVTLVLAVDRSGSQRARDVEVIDLHGLFSLNVT